MPHGILRETMSNIWIFLLDARTVSVFYKRIVGEFGKPAKILTRFVRLQKEGRDHQATLVF